MKTTEELLAQFVKAADGHAAASEAGDSSEANRCYHKMSEAFAKLKNSGELSSLHSLLNDTNVGVRLWSATFLLPTCESEAVAVLEEIRRGSGILAFDADMTLRMRS